MYGFDVSKHTIYHSIINHFMQWMLSANPCIVGIGHIGRSGCTLSAFVAAPFELAFRGLLILVAAVVVAGMTCVLCDVEDLAMAYRPVLVWACHHFSVGISVISYLTHWVVSGACV